MKVLFLDQYSDLGGAQQCLLALLPAIQERGWQAVAAAPGDGPILQAAKSLGAATEALPEVQYRSGTKSLGDVIRFGRTTPRVGRAIGGLIGRHAPDVLYINGPRLLPAAAWLARPGCPVVFHSHHHLGKRYAIGLAGRSLRTLNARVIACCDFVAAQWKSHVEPSRIQTVYNGVEDLRQPSRKARDSKTIGVVGRIAPQKGQLIFVEAAKILAARFPAVRFEIVGEALFGDRNALEYRQELARAAADLPVQFTGWIGDLAGTLAAMDVLVVPSTVPEATTRVIPEAWSAGVPVVASAVGGIAEIVQDGINGFLISHATAHAIAARVADVLSLAPDTHEAVITSGRSSFERAFTMERYRHHILEIIERL